MSGSYTYRVVAHFSTAWTAASNEVTLSVTVDTTAPTVVSINRNGSSPTNAASVTWTRDVQRGRHGRQRRRLRPRGNGTAGAAITSVTGSGTAYTVTASTGADGTLGLNLVDDDSINDTSGNPLGGAGAGNGSFAGQLYTVDKVAPSVSSINRAAASPTNATSVQWTVTFSESVTGVDTADFALVQAGGVSGASITSVTGSGAPTPSPRTPGPATARSASISSTTTRSQDVVGNRARRDRRRQRQLHAARSYSHRQDAADGCLDRPRGRVTDERHERPAGRSRSAKRHRRGRGGLRARSGQRRPGASITACHRQRPPTPSPQTPAPATARSGSTSSTTTRSPTRPATSSAARARATATSPGQVYTIDKTPPTVAVDQPRGATPDERSERPVDRDVQRERHRRRTRPTSLSSRRAA